ncbi:Ribonuclease H superfamily [Sesbania bispinosa]|nr:Ribonuclease H superfamily [Sesbania bispinosa]
MANCSQRMTPRRLSFSLEDFPKMEGGRLDLNLNTTGDIHQPENESMPLSTPQTTEMQNTKELNLLENFETPAITSGGTGNVTHTTIPTTVLNSIILNEQSLANLVANLKAQTRTEEAGKGGGIAGHGRSHATAIVFREPEVRESGFFHNRPLYVEAKIKGVKIRRALVDNGSSVNILPTHLFRMLNIPKHRMRISDITLNTFHGKPVETKGCVSAVLEVGPIRTVNVFQVVDGDPNYHLLLGRPWIHLHQCIPSTLHLCIKSNFKGKQIQIPGVIDPFEASEAHLINASLFDEVAPPGSGRIIREHYVTLNPSKRPQNRGSFPHPIPTHKRKSENGVEREYLPNGEHTEEAIAASGKDAPPELQDTPKQQEEKLEEIDISEHPEKKRPLFIGKDLKKSEKERRMSRWELMVSEYDLRIVHSDKLKSQALVDMMALSPGGNKDEVIDEVRGEMPEVNVCKEEEKAWWTLKFDGSPTNPDGGTGEQRNKKWRGGNHCVSKIKATKHDGVSRRGNENRLEAFGDRAIEAKGIAQNGKRVPPNTGEGELFKSALTGEVLRCVAGEHTRGILEEEVHQGVCGRHQGGLSLWVEILRKVYYWPSMKEDAIEFAKKCVQCQKQDAPWDWSKYLPLALWAYRTTQHGSTKATPFSLVYEAEASPTSRSDDTLRTTDFGGCSPREAFAVLVEEDREKASEELMRHHSGLSLAYEKLVKPRMFHEGELVLKATDAVMRKQHTSKWTPNWEGPYIIKEAHASGYCTLLDPEDQRIIGPINFKYVKKYYA